jgi:hypothetical protein
MLIKIRAIWWCLVYSPRLVEGKETARRTEAFGCLSPPLLYVTLVVFFRVLRPDVAPTLSASRWLATLGDTAPVEQSPTTSGDTEH